MTISIKNEAEIAGMRVAGRLASEVLDVLTPHVKPGVTTDAIDKIAHDHIVYEQGGIPAPLNYAPPGYTPYPKSICTSINHQVCHGIPNDRPLKNGDIVNIDVTVIKDGWHGDTSRMFIVGEGSIAARRLVQITYDAMWKGIVKVKPGVRLGDIGHAIQFFTEGNGFSVVREFCGHGIGQRFHEDPQVLHYGRPGTLDELKPGMTFTIEPMVNAGKRDIREAGDGWTIVTRDRSLSAQWEHTVLVTETGYEVMTLSAGVAAAAGLRRRLNAGAREHARSPSPRPDARPAPASDVRRDAPAMPRRRAARRFRDGKAARLDALPGGAADRARRRLRLVRALAADVDATLRQLWRDAAMPADAALVAVGGYGRGELFPYSDVDVLVLLPSTSTAAATRGGAATEHFITACWDAGLEIGSSVRTVDECVAMALADVTVQTALLEARFLCGARTVFKAFERATAQAMDPKAFLRAKTLEMRQRHQKYENTPYSLEPNCKESPGGLRDLQTVIWVARAAGFGRKWQELAAHGLITPFEVRQLQRNGGMLKLIRARLHAIAGRREDRLVFDLQTAIAESFGYKSLAASAPPSG